MRGILRAGVLRSVGVVCSLIAFAAATGLAVGAQNAKQGKESSAQTVQALFVSDIHFEPFWDPSKVERLAAAPAVEWQTILAEPDAADRQARFAQLEQACHTRGDDTPYALFASSLTAMQTHAAGAKFVIVSGDLMAHAFNCKYAALFPKAAPGEYRRFAEKTVEYVIGSLRSALPGVPVYAALGNNDSDCGDYQLDARDEFLATEGGVFTHGFVRGDREQAARTFALGGYYSVSLPAPMRRTRLLVLDDVFMSRRYETCGGKEDPAPAAEQIAWLEQQLDLARKRNEKVWVMAHIPPGVDPYSTAMQGKDVCTGAKPTMFLSAETLPETLAQYGDVIRLAIFAHTHMDEARLLEPPNDHASRAGVAVKLVPSISPINGNNPSFTVAAVDPETATMLDYRVIAVSNKTGAGTTWAEEYDFAKTYNEPAFSAAAVQDLIGQFSADRGAHGSASQSYIRDYDVGQPIRELGMFWPLYACALKNDEAAAFKSCVCGK
ncbi:Metallophosphoesterase [Candidatus Sulfotelmatomonas gaucii]|uniref:Metallophosphoesterase n=1 Tax=Candidatus Sulfuritelmatomonas gaucii TaxID=2043161 RepID=A0A2N9LSS1_9BACT|nr:Metallophosphoesterase [Candidatus Sulfotelmatomonas gaucii]